MHLTPFNEKLHFATLLAWFENPEIMRLMGMTPMNGQDVGNWVNDGK